MDAKTEKVGNVILDYTFYKGEDVYSDGDIEDRLLEIVQSTDDYIEVLKKENDWPILYHLSPIRHNILEWYDFDKNGSLLEIGSGCGAVTGLFCAKTGNVTAVDLSRRRSLINANRNKQYDNLRIIVGNFEDIDITEKYDYVTLIGVLEYSIYYISSDDPFIDMLKKAKSYLKEGGKIIIAIENKYGLKYWAGAKEDHTGKEFDGIQGYRDVDRVRTFSKQALTDMLKRAGFNDVDFYYPMPDYKMPMEVYSEYNLPKRGDIDETAPAYDRNRISAFDEVRAYDSLCDDGQFEFFANSFLVIGG